LVRSRRRRTRAASQASTSAAAPASHSGHHTGWFQALWAAAVALSIAVIPYFARLVEQNLRDVPRGIIDMAQACGASSRTTIVQVLLAEALPALVGSFTVTATGFIAYSAVAGAVGAGGLGDLAIRFGYYRFETNVMVWCVVIMFVLVQATQVGGGWLARRLDRR
jgi:D-methionine transport system permease protein